jgi:hypothetical protein
LFEEGRPGDRAAFFLPIPVGALGYSDEMFSALWIAEPVALILETGAGL